LLQDRYLHVAGGATMTRVDGVKYSVDYDNHWVIDLDNLAGGWRTLKPLPLARNHMAGATVNGYFYALGGQLETDEYDGNQKRVDRYDPATNTWARMPDIPIPLGDLSWFWFVLR
jgi:N-acetylneuraminic acid mutarotase